MTSFRYQAMEAGGAPVKGVIEAPDRRAALQLLGERGLFPSQLEACAANGAPATAGPATSPGASVQPAGRPATAAASAPSSSRAWGTGIRRKDITAFTREMSALLGAAIPIPQALDGLSEEEANLALKAVLTQ